MRVVLRQVIVSRHPRVGQSGYDAMMTLALGSSTRSDDSAS